MDCYIISSQLSFIFILITAINVFGENHRRTHYAKSRKVLFGGFTPPLTHPVYSHLCLRAGPAEGKFPGAEYKPTALLLL